MSNHPHRRRRPGRHATGHLEAAIAAEAARLGCTCAYLVEVIHLAGGGYGSLVAHHSHCRLLQHLAALTPSRTQATAGRGRPLTPQPSPEVEPDP